MLRFLSYHNGVPIALGVIFLGGASVFAATEPETIFSSTEQVISVDNSYISNKDLSHYTPRVEILGVTEDTENYYVAYRFSTIGIASAAWQDITSDRSLEVARGALGGEDLGVYVTEQLRQLIDHEISYLREVQDIERKQLSQKVVTTVYGGLVGKFLDDTTETLPGYVPVITPPPLVQVATSAGLPSADPQGGEVAGVSTSQIGGPGSPILQLLGPNPHRIPVGSNFADLGVVVTDDSGYIPVVRKYVDGTEVLSDFVTVDTSVPREFHIRYEATDTDGNTGAVERAVVVYDQFAPEVSPPTTDTATEEPPTADPAPPQANEFPAPETLSPASTSQE